MRDSRLAATRGACALFLCAAAAAPATAAAQDGSAAAPCTWPRRRSTKVTLPAELRLEEAAPRRRSVLVVTGTDLSGVNQLTFNGSYGKGDDVTVKVRARQQHARCRRTCRSARSPGRSRVTTASGRPVAAVEAGADPARRCRRSRIPSCRPCRARAGPARRGSRPAPAARKAFVDARPGVKFSFRLSGALGDVAEGGARERRSTAPWSRPGRRSRWRRTRCRPSPGTAGSGARPPGRAGTRSG